MDPKTDNHTFGALKSLIARDQAGERIKQAFLEGIDEADIPLLIKACRDYPQDNRLRDVVLSKVSYHLQENGHLIQAGEVLLEMGPGDVFYGIHPQLVYQQAMKLAQSLISSEGVVEEERSLIMKRLLERAKKEAGVAYSELEGFGNDYIARDLEVIKGLLSDFDD